MKDILILATSKILYSDPFSRVVSKEATTAAASSLGLHRGMVVRSLFVDPRVHKNIAMDDIVYIRKWFYYIWASFSIITTKC